MHLVRGRRFDSGRLENDHLTSMYYNKKYKKVIEASHCYQVRKNNIHLTRHIYLLYVARLSGVKPIKPTTHGTMFVQ